MSKKLKEYKKIEGYKKVDAEEYKLVSMGGGFESFPSQGIWQVEYTGYSTRSSKICDLKKFNDLPNKYPIAELALRHDEISSAIVEFTKIKHRNLLETGESFYSASELTEYIIQSLVRLEINDLRNKKVLIEKKWLQIK